VQLAAKTGIRFNTRGDIADDGSWLAFVQGVGESIRQTMVCPTSGEFQLRYSVAGRNTGPGNVGGDLNYQVTLEGGGLLEAGEMGETTHHRSRHQRAHLEM